MPYQRRVFLTGLLGLAACSSTPPETARLPEFSGLVTVNAVPYSIEQGAELLSNPSRLAGQPWETARLIQALEFLAIELRNGQGWDISLPMAQVTVPAQRREWREAFGIAATAPAQDVIDALTAVRDAFAQRNAVGAAAALRPPLFTPGGQETLNRLGAPPPLPRTRRAMLDARMELADQHDEGRRR